MKLTILTSIGCILFALLVAAANTGELTCGTRSVVLVVLLVVYVTALVVALRRLFEGS